MAMILRVRASDGTTIRVSIPPSTRIEDLTHTVAEKLGVAQKDVHLSRTTNASAEFTQPTKTVGSSGLQHGDLLFVVRTSHTAGTTRQEISNNKGKEESRENLETPTSSGQKTVRVPVRSKQCNHPPTMFCNNCIGGESDSGGEEELDDRKITSSCRHHGPHGSCIECLSRIDAKIQRIKMQTDAHCTNCSMDFAAANAFQAFLQQTGFQYQRCGWLYGRTDDETGTATVDVLYEPPQKGTAQSVELLEDPQDQRVEAIAGLLGLCRVGFIFSHPTRDTSYVLTADEVIRAAGHQRMYGSSFVTVTVHATEEGSTEFEAYQVSDQCMQMCKRNQFIPSEDPTRCNVKKEVYVEGKLVTDIDTHFFLLNVPIVSHQGPFTSDFPIENRPDHTPAHTDLKIHIISKANLKYIQRLTDFHLVVYLATHTSLDMKTDIPALCDAIRKQDEHIGEGFQIIIDCIAEV